MALIAVNATNSRLGGGLVFADMLLPRLVELLAVDGHRVRLFSHADVRGQNGWLRTVRAQRLLRASSAPADLILNMGNVAVFSDGTTPQWLIITNRLLVESRLHSANPGMTARSCLLLASMLKSERWIVPSHAMGSAVMRFCKRWGLAPRPLEVLQHGVREPTPVRRRSIVADVSYRAIYPASAAKHKNFPTIIEAVRRVRAVGRDVRLTLTIDRNELPELMAGTRLPPDIDTWLCCIGMVTHSVVEQLYTTHDVLLFPSVCESFGLPLAEAAAQNLPVIASDLDVTREVAARGTRFLPALDVERWAESLLAFTTPGAEAVHQGTRPITWDQVCHRLGRAIVARAVSL